MKRLFILGAGFSKAISAKMPLMSDLSRLVTGWCHESGCCPTTEGFDTDFEALLTYLYQEMPWKSREETHLDRAAFYAVSRRIANHVTKCETEAWQGRAELPWANGFMDYLVRNDSKIVSLNYDTLFERTLEEFGKERGSSYPVGGHYPAPLVHVGLRGGEEYELGGAGKAPCSLLKIHGSTNWFVSEDGWDSGGQVYYCNSDERDKPGFQESIQDMIPLIIPPVAEKSPFYRASFVRAIWRQFRSEFGTADEIYSVGYSLPKTDLTMRLFFGSAKAARLKAVYLVNTAKGEDADDLVQNYQEVFQGAKVDRRYLGSPDAVEAMVGDLVAGDCRPAEGASI